VKQETTEGRGVIKVSASSSRQTTCHQLIIRHPTRQITLPNAPPAESNH